MNEGALDNKHQYQGAFNEFDDDIGWNDFALRNYDPQIGRWVQQDPYQEFASPYLGMGSDPVNLIDPSGGSVFEGLSSISKAGVFMLAGAIIGGFADAVSGGNGWAGVAIGAGIGLGASFSISVTAKVVQTANAATIVINTSITTEQAERKAHGPNAGNIDDCCRELWNEIKDAAKETWKSIERGANVVGELASDIYHNGVLPAVDWLNHNVNPVYMIWNAGYSHFTGKDFLNQTPINKSETKIAAFLAVIPGESLLKLAGNQLEKLLFRQSANVVKSILKIEERTLQHMFSNHAKAFGIGGNWNKSMIAKFEEVLRNHMKNLNPIQGTYRGTQQVFHYFDPKTNLNVMTDLNGNLISGWKLSTDQIKNLLLHGNVQ